MTTMRQKNKDKEFGAEEQHTNNCLPISVQIDLHLEEK